MFEIIAEPNHRAIWCLRVSSRQSVGEIERQLGTPQPSVSKHLRVREAGFVESTADSAVSTNGNVNHFRRWTTGSPRSVGSGPLRSMLSNATSTA